MEGQKLENLFAKASRIDAKAYHTPKEWDAMRTFDGAKRFKRRALGLCGWTSVKSLDEMAHLLFETGIASSVEEGRKITPSLAGGEVNYAPYKYLKFDSVKNAEGQEAYRIEAFNSDNW